MHWCVIIIASLLIITCGRVIELHTQHTELDNNVTKSLLTTAEFENALPLSLNKSQCINVIINGEFTIDLTEFTKCMTIIILLRCNFCRYIRNDDHVLREFR